MRPIARGGYVFGSSRFQVAPGRRRLVNFSITVDCASPITVESIHLRAGGQFRFAGKERTNTGGAATVVVDGRFVTPTRAVGTIQVRAAGCPGRTSRFTATLS